MNLFFILTLSLFIQIYTSAAREVDAGESLINNSMQAAIKSCENRNQTAAENIQKTIMALELTRKEKIDQSAEIENKNKLLSMKNTEIEDSILHLNTEIQFQKQDDYSSNSKKNIIKKTLHAFDNEIQTEEILTQYYLAGEEQITFWQKNKKETVLRFLEKNKQSQNYKQELLMNSIKENNLKLPIINEQIYNLQLNINSNQSQLSKFSYMINQGCKENPSG